MPQIEIYDTTLRDGAQREGISLSLEDKVKIARRLSDLGVHYIEGGYAASNPKDAEFFARAATLDWDRTQIVAFGSTRRADTAPEADPALRALADARAPVVCIVGKSWDLHVTRILETNLEENLSMIADSVGYLRECGVQVFYDAEHFFDGYKGNADYALASLRAAADAGADRIVLCDTNGGVMPAELQEAIRAARGAVRTPLGIHVHNDTELAVANSLLAVQEGCIQVQGCVNGYGERCGNANLCSVIADLQLKMGYEVLPPERLGRLTEVAHYVSEIANLVPDPHEPFVGMSAFAHKAGLHVAAVIKHEESYQHIDPRHVGNLTRVVVSELSGRGSIVYKAEELKLGHLLHGDLARRLAEQVKEMESRGYQFEGAEASFELLLKRAQPDYAPPFEIVDFRVATESGRPRSSLQDGPDGPAPSLSALLSEATVKVQVRGEVHHTVAEGTGPVDALDHALRRAVERAYPGLRAVHLVDYKVRILDSAAGTGAAVRVLIESSDGEDEWVTVGSSANIIEASWLALADSLEYWLLRQGPAGPAT